MTALFSKPGMKVIFLLFEILIYLWGITVGAGLLMLFAESTHCSHQAY